MKRIVIVLVIALAGAGMAMAQPAVGQRMGGGFVMGRGYAPNAQADEDIKTTTIEGKLVFVDKVPALQAKDKTYILRWPGFFYYAYTDGIKEGVQVKAEGYEMPTFPGQDKPYFGVTVATIGSKTYDLSKLELPCAGMGGGMGMGRTNERGGRGGRGGRW